MCLPSLLFYFISFVIIILIFRLHCRHLFFRVSEREREKERACKQGRHSALKYCERI
jgi:hypothetical protein